ncbi:MAG TPA: methylated-DNA--[protein]-cysteine S-methyltransferase [Planctomycetes bacterium]|nr:methylated-DNA--[protein]-cysteine S-methyltransferase [Planctomycetota bacterium]
MKNRTVRRLEELMASSLRYAIFRTRWGWFGLLGTERGLLRTCLPISTRSKAKSALLKDIWAASYDRKLFVELQAGIKAYFEGVCVDFAKIPVVLDGLGDFGTAVLTACRKVQYGQTISYGQLAGLTGKPKAGRAAGNILARNPVPLIIPCHRVIRSNRRIGGFSAAGGRGLKKRMLQLEGFQLADGFQTPSASLKKEQVWNDKKGQVKNHSRYAQKDIR